MSLRPLDPYGQTMVSEAAAATANALFWEVRLIGTSSSIEMANSFLV